MESMEKWVTTCCHLKNPYGNPVEQYHGYGVDFHTAHPCTNFRGYICIVFLDKSAEVLPQKGNEREFFVYSHLKMESRKRVFHNIHRVWKNDCGLRIV